ncbi:MAG: carboxymuconolactone decarboxylase family protein [Vicinamibacterales bacterium]
MLERDGLSAVVRDALVAGLTARPSALPHLTARERALVAYADALTLAPGGMSAAHVQALRDVGLDDRAIHDACAVVAYFAFVNRIADGLGVELETTG